MQKIISTAGISWIKSSARFFSLPSISTQSALIVGAALLDLVHQGQFD